MSVEEIGQYMKLASNFWMTVKSELAGRGRKRTLTLFSLYNIE